MTDRDPDLDDTDEYAALDARAVLDAREPTDSPDPASDLAYFTSLDAPRWAILLAGVGLAWAGAMVMTAAVRRIVGALGY